MQEEPLSALLRYKRQETRDKRQETRDKRQEADVLTVNQQAEPQPNPDAKVAIISYCYGPIEATTKSVAEQTVPCDKIFFTDNPNINNRGNWIIDTTPYHITHNKYIDTDYTNSWKNNKTNYMISKYYKTQFMDIPRLQKYDYVLVIDGTMEITNKDCAKLLIDKTEKENSNMVCWMNDGRNGDLYIEYKVHANDPRWKTVWRGQRQPFQDLLGQYNAYIKNGYTTKYWRERSNGDNRYGLFWTGFIFYKMNDGTRKFLNQWYEEMLKWTTECQMSFTYVLQMLHKNDNYKFSVLPDDLIKGKLLSVTSLTKRYSHGR